MSIGNKTQNYLMKEPSPPAGEHVSRYVFDKGEGWDERQVLSECRIRGLNQSCIKEYEGRFEAIEARHDVENFEYSSEYDQGKRYYIQKARPRANSMSPNQYHETQDGGNEDE